MERLEQEILEYFQMQARTISFEEINKDFEDKYEKDDILTAIVKLEKNGKIFRNRKNNFQIWHNGLKRIFGTIKLTAKGAGILKEESGNITFIHKDFLNGALSGDKVIVKDLRMVRPHEKDKERQEGKVERIVERAQNTILCEVVNNNGVKTYKQLSENPNLKVKINREDIKQYYDGDLILVKISSDSENDYFPGTILKRVCHKDDPTSDILGIAAIHGFEQDFPDDVKEEVKNIPKDISNEDLSTREDKRKKLVFTIDSEDTKDIDDALSMEILPNGNRLLSVHIADVSHYVKPGTALFREALKRGTSVYMLNSVIPMLPRELSNGICSLNPNEDRLAKTCEMEIDKDGNIVNTRIVNSVICSKKKMTYTAVNEIIEKGIIPKGYEEYEEILKEMHYLSKQMESKRKNQGTIEFNKPEMRIKTDLKGRPKEIKVLYQRSAEKLIENFMLAANESVATTISNKKLPFIYRVHKIPNIDKLNTLAEIIESNIPKMKRPSAQFSSSKVVQKFIERLSQYKEYPGYSDLILRCMSKAEYSSENVGHFGLAMANYTHFTSPIRRFPDLLVHHLLNLYENTNANEMNIKELRDNITMMAILSSERETAAQRAEYDANDMKSAEFMENRIGEEFSGIITDITEKGMRVRLNNLIEGFVATKDIEPKSFFKYYRSKKTLESDFNTYKIGDEIVVRVKTANKQTKTINFIAEGRVKDYDMHKTKTKKSKTKNKF